MSNISEFSNFLGFLGEGITVNHFYSLGIYNTLENSNSADLSFQITIILQINNTHLHLAIAT